MTILQQVVKQRQSICQWLLLLLFFSPGKTSPSYMEVQENGTATLVLYYDLKSTQHPVQAHLDHRPPNKTSFDPVVAVSILSENNFTVTLNPHGYDLVNLTKKMIIVRIPFVRPKCAGDYRFTAMNPETTSSIFSLIVTDIDKCVQGAHGCAHNCTIQEEGPVCSCFVGYVLNEDNKTCKDVAQNYNPFIPVVGGAVVLLLVLIGIGVYCMYPKLFNLCSKTTASASENSAQDDRAENQPLQGNNGHLHH